MKICILKDKDFTPIPEYTGDDVSKALAEHDREHTFVHHQQLEELERADCDCLVLPYLTGNFSKLAFKHMMELHQQGTSLCILGDVPHIDSWYPIRNMLSFEMHLTRYQEKLRFIGLTDKGREILGELKGFDQFTDHDIPALRITGFPEDVTHSLIDNAMNDWHFPSVVAIERKSELYMAAKVAQIGFTGGEPREVALGVYPMKWEYDIGPLNRDWSGINDVVRNLLEWCKPTVNGAVQFTPVHKENESSALKVIIRNPTSASVRVDSICLTANGQTAPIFTCDEIILKAGDRQCFEIEVQPRSAGMHNYALTASLDGSDVTLHTTTEHVVSSSASTNPIGFGASSHYGYKEPKQSEEAKHFLRQLKARGCQYFRMNVPWEEIEPEPGVYNWGLTDDMIAFAEQEELTLAFWLFPTTRGCGLGDAGVPEWILKEPAIDRDGNPGNFPSIWSPYYRSHYFSMIEALCKRYANSDSLNRLIIDFGNSDFPYGYYYYVNDTSLFDYSPYERAAFTKYLRDNRDLSLAEIGTLCGRDFASLDEVPVPYIEDQEIWGYYLDFRTWSIQQGMREVLSIIEKHAPGKMPPDVPGHGLGSIADLGANWHDVKKRHWYEEKKFQFALTRLHSAGLIWGGEAWQVGGSFKELDDALFGSLRFNATYNTVPGPDLNVFGEDLARIGYIRRSIMGAERRHPEIAFLGRASWNTWNSISQVGSRMDQAADYLGNKHRFNFSCYRLLALPTSDFANTTVTGGGGAAFLPHDEPYYWLLRESVEKGLNLLVFPESCVVGRDTIQQTFLRQVCDLMDVSYGPSQQRTVVFPDAFGGGTLSGNCCSVMTENDDEVLVRDDKGDAVLVRRQFGTGSFLLAGWDDLENDIDSFHYMNASNMKQHTFVRIAEYLGIPCRDVRAEQSCVYKEKLTQGELEFFLAYNHSVEAKTQRIEIRLNTTAEAAVDLATGERFSLEKSEDGWHSFTITLYERKGRYLQFGI